MGIVKNIQLILCIIIFNNIMLYYITLCNNKNMCTNVFPLFPVFIYLWIYFTETTCRDNTKHIHIHTYTYIYTYICTYIHIYIYIHIHIYTYIHIHTYIYTYTHTYIYTYTHTYIYIYIYIYILAWVILIISSRVIPGWNNCYANCFTVSMFLPRD